MKKFLLIAAGLCLFGLVSLGLLGACVISAGRSFSVSADEKATRQETHPLEISAGQTLRIDLAGGDVRVRAGETSAGISAQITAWGATQAEADKALANAKLEITTSASGATVSLEDATLEVGQFGGNYRLVAEADLEIAIPPGVRLQIESRSGDIDARGPFEGSKVHSAYGSVRIEKVAGDLEATSSSGDVAVAAVNGTSIEAKSGYGSVALSDCESTRITAKSSSGDVRIEDSRADRVQIESGYGDLEIARIGGEIEAKTSSGDVRAKAFTGPIASLASGYGSVQVDGGTGKLSASSSSGDVRITGFQGSVEAKSGYGSVHVEGVLKSVEAESSSGDVSVSGTQGSEVSTTWKIASNYGSGKLELPADLAFDIDARTNYGKIERGFPIELGPGTDDRNASSLQGRVNGGGGRIEIRCKSGDVIFRPSGK
ncbi:MAG: DUF4097 family beta strand repeat-containing protein [Planctomycetota bacterium]